MKIFLLCLCVILGSQQVISMSEWYQRRDDGVWDHVRGSVSLHFRKDKQQCDNLVSKDDLVLLKDIRARIVLNQSYKEEILKQIEVPSIENSVKDVLKKEEQRLFLLATVSKKKGSYSSDELVKLSLLTSVLLSWDRAMEILRKLSPGKGVVYDYSFETAVFVMFLAPEYPGMFYRLWYPKAYSEEMIFYRVCLASALKKCMETITKEQICIAGREAPGKSIIENICLGCLQLISKNPKAKED